MKLKTLHDDASAKVLAKSIRKYLMDNGYRTNLFVYPNSHILARNAKKTSEWPLPQMILTIRIENDDLGIEMKHYADGNQRGQESVDIHDPNSLQKILAYVKKHEA